MRLSTTANRRDPNSPIGKPISPGLNAGFRTREITHSPVRTALLPPEVHRNRPAHQAPQAISRPLIPATRARTPNRFTWNKTGISTPVEVRIDEFTPLKPALV